jgi:predicted nucleotidyltransferase
LNKIAYLHRVFKKYDVALAYLFGSRAENGSMLLGGQDISDNDPLADIDVGIVFKKELPDGLDRANLYSNIYNDLEEIFRPHPLDLVFLQETHSVFQANAISGHCIYAASSRIQEEYEENVLRLAADFRPFLELYLDEMLEEV